MTIEFEEMSPEDVPPEVLEMVQRNAPRSAEMDRVLAEFRVETARVMGEFVMLHSQLLWGVMFHVECAHARKKLARDLAMNDMQPIGDAVQQFMGWPGERQIEALRKSGCPESVVEALDKLRGLRNQLVHANFYDAPMWLRGVTPEPAWWKTVGGVDDKWFTLHEHRAAIIEMRLAAADIPGWLYEAATEQSSGEEQETG
ncbi:hypothetical protein [Candidatus Poriferisodalis sp.]|uniref:hypothetical protein n=1 Tax=Candidatus Poriferisodalis sp. TaxID=3101277 RepID=UPI003B018C73